MGPSGPKPTSRTAPDLVISAIGPWKPSQARNIAAVVDLYEANAYADENKLVDLAKARFGLTLTVMAPGKLPVSTQGSKPFFDLLDKALSEEISGHVKRPYWVDTVGQSRHVEIRVKLENAILRFTAPRGLAYASNSHIFLVWMVGTSVVLLTVAILFLRNQIKPILRLADAAERLGKGRPIPPDFKPPSPANAAAHPLSFDLQRFRLSTGAPIYIDFKSIPYRDVEVLEWFDRVLWTDRFYHQLGADSLGNLHEELRQRGITYVVVRDGLPVHSRELAEVFAGDGYRLYRVKP